MSLPYSDEGSTLSRNQKQEDNMFSLSPHVAAAVARPRLALALASVGRHPGRAGLMLIEAGCCSSCSLQPHIHQLVISWPGPGCASLPVRPLYARQAERRAMGHEASSPRPKQSCCCWDFRHLIC